MPWLAVAGVVCVGLPVAVHLWSRSRRRRADWGAMRFLQLAYRKQRRRLQMERWVLLAARCLLVVLAGLALAGPLVGGGVVDWISGGRGAMGAAGAAGGGGGEGGRGGGGWCTWCWTTRWGAGASGWAGAGRCRGGNVGGVSPRR